MAYPYFNPYYPQPMPDNLMQMRQQQMMQPMQQPMLQPVQQNPIAQGGVQWVNGEQEARGYSRDEDYSRRYSRDGDWQSGMRGAYDRDMSNARRGTHYVRGHYSRDGGIDNMKRQLQEMLDNADDDSIRRAIQRCMDTIEG